MDTTTGARMSVRRVVGWLGRVGAVLVVPPLVALAVVVAGVGIDRSGAWPGRAGLALLLVGPGAVGIGGAAAVALGRGLLGGSRLVAWPAVAVGVVAVFLTWATATDHFVKSWR